MPAEPTPPELENKIYPGLTDPIPMNYRTVEIISQSYDTLFEAMGHKKYEAFTQGGGLMSAPKEIREAIQDISPDGATYSIGEFTENGELKRRMFIDKTWKSGVRCVYTVNMDKSKPYLYNLDNIYTVSPAGKTVDLLEEVDKSVRCYFVPVYATCYDFKANTIYFGDLDQLSWFMGLDAGIPAYAHEIGHFKDTKLNKDIWNESLKLDKKITATKISAILRYSEGVGGKIGNKIYELFPEQLKQMGKMLVDNEYRATDFACLFIAYKRKTGVDLAPNQPGPEFAEQLQAPLYDNEMVFLGSSDIDPPYRSYDRNTKNLPSLKRAHKAITKNILFSQTPS